MGMIFEVSLPFAYYASPKGTMGAKNAQGHLYPVGAQNTRLSWQVF